MLRHDETVRKRCVGACERTRLGVLVGCGKLHVLTWFVVIAWYIAVCEGHGRLTHLSLQVLSGYRFGRVHGLRVAHKDASRFM